jgi:hypothetical protein
LGIAYPVDVARPKPRGDGQCPRPPWQTTSKDSSSVLMGATQYLPSRAINGPRPMGRKTVLQARRTASVHLAKKALLEAEIDRLQRLPARSQERGIRTPEAEDGRFGDLPRVGCEKPVDMRPPPLPAWWPAADDEESSRLACPNHMSSCTALHCGSEVSPKKSPGQPWKKVGTS